MYLYLRRTNPQNQLTIIHYEQIEFIDSIKTDLRYLTHSRTGVASVSTSDVQSLFLKSPDLVHNVSHASNSF